MNPPLTFLQAKVQLNLLTSQTSNFTFTDDEITQALQTAWNDTYVVQAVWDSSLTYTDGIWQYAIPATVNMIQDLYTQVTTTSKPERVSPDIYDITAGNIQFLHHAGRWFSTGQSILVKGRYKLLTTDNLTTNNLVNYVLYLAAESLLANLILKKTFVFLRNDTSLADAVRALQVIQGTVLRYKQALLREFESA